MVHPRATHATEKCICRETFATIRSFKRRLLAGTHLYPLMDTVNQHPTTTHFSIQGILPRNRATLFVESKPTVWFRKGHEDNAAPAFAVVTAHVPKSTHSSTRPFAPLSAHRSASLLCSRKVCVIRSAVRRLKRTPRPHHSRRRIWAFSTAGTFVFILACPFTQSTIVFLLL